LGGAARRATMDDDATAADATADELAAVVSTTAAPTDRPLEVLDARTLPPPQPLQRTLETLAELDDSAVLVQVNDRAPQLLFPRLVERGYRYETVEHGAGVVTAIWRD